MMVAGASLLALVDTPSGLARTDEGAAPASVATAAHAESQASNIQSVVPASADHGGIVSVGPGRVAFAMTRTGRWLGFGLRGGERRLVERGGFVVLARDGRGRLFQVADTRDADVQEAPGIESLGRVTEGEPNGARYPSARPDDDNDGRTDEDCLDGVDNDGDGRIDEDFAAIGDEMVVAECTTTPDSAPILGDGQPADGCAVSLHQECYAWSLTHIDGMAALALTVRNTGSVALDGIRVGAVFDRDGDFQSTTQNLGDSGYNFGTPLTAKAMTIKDTEWPALAVLFATDRPRGPEPSWLTGVARSGYSMVDVVNAAERPDALARPDRRFAGEGSTPARGTETGASAEESGKTREVYGISPSLGTLDPGDQVTVYVALVAVPSAERESHVIEDAYRTIEGDQSHRMIPPPVSITRRNLWGSYRLRVPGDASAGVTLTLVDPRGQNINPSEINQLEGVDLQSATRTEMPNGDVTFEITGEVPDEIASSERAVLGGRTQTGEIFNAILRPAEGVGEASAEVATHYWNTAGKLDESLLSGSPNPFRVATTIYYEVPSRVVDENGAEVVFTGTVETSVKVYNVAGRLVSQLVEANQGPGRYDVQWAAQDAAGTGVASGVYYVKLQIGKRFVTKRLIQLK